MGTRTNIRSRSGAHVPCPECGKRLRTQKGLAQHLADTHQPVDATVAASLVSAVADAILPADEVTQ